jgi:hypothetical protein
MAEDDPGTREAPFGAAGLGSGRGAGPNAEPREQSAPEPLERF